MSSKDRLNARREASFHAAQLSTKMVLEHRGSLVHGAVELQLAELLRLHSIVPCVASMSFNVLSSTAEVWRV